MASAKMQKPTNEEHKFSQKISEVTAWGSRMFGHKQQEHQAGAKHCTTCQCPASKDVKSTCTDTHKKEQPNTAFGKETKSGACTETKKKEKERKKEKQHTASIQTKDVKQPAKKEPCVKSNATNASNTMSKTEVKDEPANHCFSSMADHWKEKILMMKKAKEGKNKDNSSDSESEAESCVMKKTNKGRFKTTKTTSK
ncbi:unnamed protein product [Amaranthus hypochondriacus]